MKLACLILANSNDPIDGKQSRKAADRGGKRAEHAELRAIVAIVRIECIADEATIAGMRSEQPDLSLELDCRRRDERRAQLYAGVADRQARREIIAAVDDDIVAVEQGGRIVAVDAFLNGPGVDKAVEAADELKR
jgi:hypothetical protein